LTREECRQVVRGAVVAPRDDYDAFGGVGLARVVIGVREGLSMRRAL
jgi:hypothetical protein